MADQYNNKYYPYIYVKRTPSRFRFFKLKDQHDKYLTVDFDIVKERLQEVNKKLKKLLKDSENKEGGGHRLCMLRFQTDVDGRKLINDVQIDF